MPFLLMVFLTVACLPKWDPQAPPGWIDSVFWSAVLTWSAVAFTAVESYWSARRIRRAVERDPGRRDRLAAAYERRRFERQLLLLGLFALSIYGFSWGWAVAQYWSWRGDGAAPMVGVKVLTLAPFFVSLLLSWVFAYDADRSLFLAAFHSTDASPSAREAAKEFGRRWSYVVFQARQKLALVFLPVLLLDVQQEIGLQYEQMLQTYHIDQKTQDEWAWLLSVAGVTSVFAVMICLPWMVRLALGLKPLPPGPTRDRLTAAARRLRFRCSDVLLWNTRGGMANAMVIGVLPWPRYVVFTDRFLEEFNGDEVEAVFGHEVGHIKHHHMPYYLGFFMLSMAVMLYACLYRFLAVARPGPRFAERRPGRPAFERRLDSGEGGGHARLYVPRFRLPVAALRAPGRPVWLPGGVVRPSRLRRPRRRRRVGAGRARPLSDRHPHIHLRTGEGGVGQRHEPRPTGLLAVVATRQHRAARGVSLWFAKGPGCGKEIPTARRPREMGNDGDFDGGARDIDRRMPASGG